VLHAPLYELADLKEVKAGHMAALVSLEPRQESNKGKDKEGEELTRGRKTVRDSQHFSAPQSRSRKAASEGLMYSLWPYFISLMNF
jgi:hypothetical protein